MSHKDQDVQLLEALKATREELEGSREIVRTLANELAEVIDIVEPALAEHTKRLRQSRMSSIEELRQISSQVKEVRELMLSDRTEQMLVRAERFLKVCEQLEEFRAVGFLDAFVQLFVTAGHQGPMAS